MNKDNIKVSVIAPVYNVATYLPQCIKSIQNQSHRNLEIILVDDGSIDNSGNIADCFAEEDSRIKVIHKQNSGVSAARNTGIDAATGDYVCFVDADDYVASDYVEYFLELALQYDADIALSAAHFTTFHTEQVAKDYIEVLTPEQATIRELYYAIPIGCYCKLFRRKFLGDELRFFEDIFIGEGFNFACYTFQRANKVVVGHKKLYYYRRDNSNSAMTKFNVNKVLCGVKAMSRIRENLLNPSPDVIKAWEYATWHTYSDMYNFIVLGDAQKVYPELHKEYLTYTRKKAYKAFTADVPFREKRRAFIFMVWPQIYPYLMKKRFERIGVKNK